MGYGGQKGSSLPATDDSQAQGCQSGRCQGQGPGLTQVSSLPRTSGYFFERSSELREKIEDSPLLSPFQQLMTRKRKDVKAEDVKVKVCVYAFDLLFFNGLKS
jgi:hypothetical protein